MGMLRKAFSVIFVAFSCLGSSQAADSVDRPDLRVGDVWKYRSLDGFTNEVKVETTFRIVELTASEVTTQLELKGRPTQGQMIFDRQWNLLDDGASKFEPFRPEFKFPMSIGSTWKQQAQKTVFSSGATYLYFTEAKIAGNEKVVVPAGSFDTLRIETEIESRSTGSDGTVTKFLSTAWYSREVNRFVRLDIRTIANGRVRDKFIMELTEYWPSKIRN